MTLDRETIVQSWDKNGVLTMARHQLNFLSLARTKINFLLKLLA